MLIRHLSMTGRKDQSGVAYPLQIFDLLQLSRRELESKQCFRMALREYEIWKKAAPETNPILFPYVRMRGALLHRQVRDAVRLYKFVRRKRVEFFKAYIDLLPDIKGCKRLVS